MEHTFAGIFASLPFYYEVMQLANCSSRRISQNGYADELEKGNRTGSCGKIVGDAAGSSVHFKALFGWLGRELRTLV